MLALGITLAVVLAVWIGLVGPLTSLYAGRSERLSQRQTLARHMEQLAATRPALEARAAELGRQSPSAVTANGNILSGSSTPVATAALQSLVQDIATNAGASLSSVESLPGETVAGYRRVGVKLSLSASWPVLIRFLQSLEQSNTPMAVDDLQIRSSASSSAADQQPLDAGLSIYAPAGPAIAEPTSDSAK
jgi:general secretion pathway protein M